jgi:hypothetical protein
MSHDIVKTLDLEHGVKAHIVCDEDPSLHPRRDQDNLATMVCWHRRYDLGDTHEFKDPDHMWAHLLEQVGDVEKLRPVLREMWDKAVREDYGHRMRGLSRRERADGLEEFICEQVRYGTTPAVRERIIEVLKGAGVIHCIKPLYLFDHSGITISTGCGMFRAHDPQGWDWGQVGYVFVSEERRKVMGTPPDRVEQCLDGEVSEYDQYLRGEVYGYWVQTPDAATMLDSPDTCWGFIGMAWAEEAASDAGRFYAKRYGSPAHYMAGGI